MAEKPVPSTPREPETPTTTPGFTPGTVTTTPAVDNHAGNPPPTDSALQAQAATAQLSTALALTPGPKASLKGPVPPQPPIVQVKLVDEKIGFRVFALRAFAKGEQLYREGITLEATHHVHPKGHRNAYERYVSLPAARRNAMPAVNNIDPDAAASSRLLIGSRVLGGVAVDVGVTADQHRRMRRTVTGLRRLFPRNPRKETLEWFRRYAFRLEPTSTLSQGHSQAGVYLLTGLINHRCAGYFNCRVVTNVDEIKLVAERSIGEGDELTINYGKDKADFACRGPCCQRR